MDFHGFSKKGIEFLSQIVINNSKEWLDENREIYEKEIVDINRQYVSEMGELLQVLVPQICAIPKVNKSLFRIYRDARYHPLEPIKEKIGIIFWQGELHRMQSSSFYMHYETFEVFVATGIRNFKPPLLQTYRRYIKEKKEREELHFILEELKSKGYKLPEPKFKRFPIGMSREDEYSYLYLFGAMFSYVTYEPNDTFYSRDVIECHFKIHEDMFDLHQWVYRLTLEVED